MDPTDVPKAILFLFFISFIWSSSIIWQTIFKCLFSLWSVYSRLTKQVNSVSSHDHWHSYMLFTWHHNLKSTQFRNLEVVTKSNYLKILTNIILQPRSPPVCMLLSHILLLSSFFTLLIMLHRVREEKIYENNNHKVFVQKSSVLLRKELRNESHWVVLNNKEREHMCER